MSGIWYNQNMKRCLGLCVSALLLMLCSANVGAVERETDFIVDIDPQVMLVVPNEPVRLIFRLARVAHLTVLRLMYLHLLTVKAAIL